MMSSLSAGVAVPSLISDPQQFSSILKTLPDTDSVKPNWQSALHQLAFTVVALLVSFYLLSSSSYIIFAFALFFTCCSLTVLNLIANDCAHNLYTPSTTINSILSAILLLPFYQTPASSTMAVSASGVAAPVTKYADDGSYDDSVPIYFTLLQWINHHARSASSLFSYSLLGALTVYFLYSAPLSYVRYWLLPLVLYPFVFPYVFQILSNNIETLVTPSLSETIPSYHLGMVSTLIGDYVSGKANKLHTNVPVVRSHNLVEEWRSFILDTWPRLHWVNIVFVCFVPIFGFIGARYVPLTTPTLVWSLIYYVVSGLGITAGYHRLFAHRAYEAKPSIIVLMMLMGTAALQGSVKWWCGGHRIHHRYTDTDLDPYSAKTGFWYAHIGWMLVHPKPEFNIKADLKDLNDHTIIRWQHRNYIWFGPYMAFVFPALVAGLGWGDWSGGLIYAGIIRLFAVHHATFCVNSVAHWFGDHTFDDNRTPRDHIITAFLTFGEGYHNFHHEFPNDYRNGIRAFDYDPTKWLIKALNLLGLTYQLRVFPANEIAKGKVHMKQKQLSIEKSHVTYPPSIETLPELSWMEIKEQVKLGKQLTVIDDLVHDISTFIPRHPGGKAFIESSIGCDATVRFRGDTGVYKHSQAAHHLLSGYRVARLKETEEERRDRKEKEAERLKKYSKQW